MEVSRAQQVAREEQPLAADVGVQAVACVGLESLHEIVAAQEDLIRECCNREVVREVLVDVAQDLLDLGIVGDGVERFELVVLDAAVEQDQEFNKENLCVQPLANPSPWAVFSSLSMWKSRSWLRLGSWCMTRPVREPPQSTWRVGTLVEALQEVGCDVDDDALVRCLLAVPAEHGAVNLAGCDEEMSSGCR